MESLDISGVDDLVSDSQPATQPLSLSSDDGDLEEGEDVAVEPDENDFDPEIVSFRSVITQFEKSNIVQKFNFDKNFTFFLGK